MKHNDKFVMALIAAFLGMVFSVVAEDKVAQKQAQASGDDRAALEAQKQVLEVQRQEIEQKLWKVVQPMSQAREHALKTDAELMVMNREIADKQVALEKKLLEKYPDFAAQMKEQEALSKKLSEIGARLTVVREKMYELNFALRASEARKIVSELESAGKTENTKTNDVAP